MHCKTTNLYHQKIILHVILMLFRKLLSTHTHTHTHTMYFYIFFNLILYKIVNNYVVTGIQDLDTIVMNND